MTRRSRAQIFQETVDQIKKRKFVARAELSRDILTDGGLFNKIIESLKEMGVIQSNYVFTPTGRQREMLIATPNLENSELLIRALGRVVAPTLKEMFDIWYTRRHQAAEPQKTSEELEKEKRDKKFMSLITDYEEKGRYE